MDLFLDLIGSKMTRIRPSPALNVVVREYTYLHLGFVHSGLCIRMVARLYCANEALAICAADPLSSSTVTGGEHWGLKRSWDIIQKVMGSAHVIGNDPA